MTNRFRHSFLMCCLLAFLGLGSVGCYEKTLRDDWATFKDLSQTKGARSGRGGGSDGSVDSDGYAVQVASFEGNDASEQANKLASKLKEDFNLVDLWVRDLDHESDVMRGRYMSPGVEDAQRDLEQIQQITINGRHPYSDADVIPLGKARAVDLGEMDLTQYSGKYSLQVAYFDAESGSEYRKLAENEARALRKSGAEAYFYHGDNMSLVTVGIFDDSDFIRSGNAFSYGEKVRMLQSKYPYNRGNGHLIEERKDDKVVGNQPSFLVKTN